MSVTVANDSFRDTAFLDFPTRHIPCTCPSRIPGTALVASDIIPLMDGSAVCPASVRARFPTPHVRRRQTKPSKLFMTLLDYSTDSSPSTERNCYSKQLSWSCWLICSKQLLFCILAECKAGCRWKPCSRSHSPELRIAKKTGDERFLVRKSLAFKDAKPAV